MLLLLQKFAVFSLSSLKILFDRIKPLWFPSFLELGIFIHVADRLFLEEDTGWMISLELTKFLFFFFPKNPAILTYPVQQTLPLLKDPAET